MLKLPEKFSPIARMIDQHLELLRYSYIGEKLDESPDNRTTASKFGGNRPYIGADQGDSWPACEECKERKIFVCQINLAEIPQDVQNHIGLCSGLFQLYFCFDCSPFQGVFKDVAILPAPLLAPSPLKVLAGVATARAGPNLEAATVPVSLKKFVKDLSSNTGSTGKTENKCKYPECYVSWRRNSAQEIMNQAEKGLFSDIAEELVEQFYENECYEIQGPARGIKLGGYISWVQGVEYPTCPTCGVTMNTTFLQIEADELFLNSWGDCGVAHVTLCPNCKKPGLGWACG